VKNVPDTRTRLVEVAMDLIWPRSYGAVSVDMICKASGVFKGSFYHFFPTKADLMAAALEHYWLTNQPHFDRIFSPPPRRWNRSESTLSMCASGRLRGAPRQGAFLAVLMPASAAKSASRSRLSAQRYANW
jgi:TetR/AcrR family transcriptional regulator, transcriptional repressor for nem operon